MLLILGSTASLSSQSNNFRTTTGFSTELGGSLGEGRSPGPGLTVVGGGAVAPARGLAAQASSVGSRESDRAHRLKPAASRTSLVFTTSFSRLAIRLGESVAVLLLNDDAGLDAGLNIGLAGGLFTWRVGLWLSAFLTQND
eukprot:CAMPEP_0181235818 /NCGR_PEP_ID=MMETSP1096-20121128/37799_1 /TAXON_ID=156174 ORGANISM="Chrysochromulina ericina, Strain CCMP281" /NCGR_SAMPLE_ID=MMETSP1096 /ASSEMBLY_ACC=CAM_ASM_000453 /LENGTH=140 /DNA_ID=CAMNT_0023330865 /DNA_START=337 /DNA_END=757 /DNA_ORIENTATION=+